MVVRIPARRYRWMRRCSSRWTTARSWNSGSTRRRPQRAAGESSTAESWDSATRVGRSETRMLELVVHDAPALAHVSMRAACAPVQMWAASSAGRAPRSQRGGREFDPPAVHQILLTGKPLRTAFFFVRHRCEVLRPTGANVSPIHPRAAKRRQFDDEDEALAIVSMNGRATRASRPSEMSVTAASLE